MTNNSDYPRIPYGYKAYTGKVLSNLSVDNYNAVSDRCQSFIDAGRPVPEYILNGKHNLFVAISTIYK